MKNDWPVKKLGEVISFEYGKSLPEKIRIPGEYPVYGSNGQVGLNNKYLIKGPGVVVGRKGSIGEVVWSEKDFWPIDTTYFIKIREDDDLRFIYYLLQTLNLDLLNKASGVPGLNRNDAYSLVISVPEINQQIKIVVRLDAIRKAQELVDFQIQKTEELFLAALKEELEKKDNLQNLGELVKLKNGRAFKTSEWKSLGIPIIRIQNLNNNDASFNYFNGTYSKDILIKEGDLLFSWSGTIGTSFGAHIWIKEDGLLNQHIFKVNIHNDNTINKKYLYYYLKKITADIEKNAHGAVGLVHVTKTELDKTKINVPALKNQVKIVEKLDAIQDYKKLLQKRKTLYKELFDSVLDKSMKGELD